MPQICGGRCKKWLRAPLRLGARSEEGHGLPTEARYRRKWSKLRRVGRHFVSRGLAFSNKNVSGDPSGCFLSRWQEPNTDAVLAIQMPKLYVPRKPQMRRDM